MRIVDASAVLEPQKTPFGKVIGILENREQLQAVSEVLSMLGVREVEVLKGATGIKLLDGEKDAVSQCFLGDMEAAMVQRYLDAAKNGLIVFAAAVAPEMANEAAEVAKLRGASNVVHFGNWVITNY